MNENEIVTVFIFTWQFENFKHKPWKIIYTTGVMTHASDRNVSMQTQLTNKHMNMLILNFGGWVYLN